MSDKFTCPRRTEDGADSEVFTHGGKLKDEWRSDGTCSYCGSMDPAEFLRLVEAGNTLIPTDKNYKAYLRVDGENQRKVYFQHFDEAQKHQLLKLLQAGAINFAAPGHFYRLPFFIVSGPPKTESI